MSYQIECYENSMEFFIPSLIVFLIVSAVIVFVLPKLSPLILVVLAAILLAFGIFTHYKTFAFEYKQSTVFSNFKIYAPAIMIVAIIVFMLFSIASFFTNGTVPIPSIPVLSFLPSAGTATNKLTESINRTISMLNSKPANAGTNTKNTSFSKLPIIL